MRKFQLVSTLVFFLFGAPLFAEHGSSYGSELDHVLVFPHFANGESIESELVLVNLGSASAPMIYFSNTDGEAVMVESLVEITEDLVVLEDGGLSTVDMIPSLGEVTISTNGSGEGAKGSVKVVSSTLYAGFLRFKLPQGVAGVASAGSAHNFTVPVQRKEGGINTGLAIHNPNDQRLVRVDCMLMKDGEVLDSVDIDLEASGQDSRFIDELFMDSDTSDFSGSVSCEASGTVSGVALELDYLSGAVGVFTTLPVILRPSGADFFTSPE